jgi:hypothetical protein
MALEHRIPFQFHAEGHAVSGTFHRPIPHVIEAQASASLPSIGGLAQARVENFRAMHLLSFKSAHTHISGSKQEDDVVTTCATTVVEGLDILGVIRADRVVARVSAEHDPRKPENKEGHILAFGSEFVNLRVAGQKVEIKLRHDLFLNCETFGKLRDKLKADRTAGHESDIYGELALCSVVEDIELQNSAGIEKIGRHVLKVAHLGTISFGEVFATPGSRTLTMARMHLGSPDGATLTLAQACTNGRPWPPPP